MAIERPDLFRSLLIHEPLFFGVVPDPRAEEPLKDTLARVDGVIEELKAGRMEAGCRLFMESVVSGPGTWEQVPLEVREKLVSNAPTFLDENLEQGWSRIDLDKLRTFQAPMLLTKGDQSPDFLLYIADKLAQRLSEVQMITIEGAGHGPQGSHPEEYAEIIKAFTQQ